MFVARPTLFVEQLFKPAIWALNGSGQCLVTLIGIQPASGHQLVHSIEELKMLVTASAESGVVEVEESEMLHAIFDFGELVVRQVMVPRTEVIAVEADTPLEDIIGLVTHSSYTKFPVYEENLDHIVGIVHVKDLLACHAKGGLRGLYCAHLRPRTLIRAGDNLGKRSCCAIFAIIASILRL